MTPNPVSWSTNPSSSSATTTPWWNGSDPRVGRRRLDRPDHASPLLVSVFLDKDFTFVVSSEAEARRSCSSTRPHADPAGARFH
ncbi:fatty-acid synthase domain protein [Mycobacterium xenopi 4042]|uniref:Fatty-acid synthase domain protein n=1 Tax=Mycobacterium xenopi 4042 TaxID=1299334 RepID=X8E3G6_MYCXE|nr:fatty-acid synthase domain protein [Mycobacterium xenopi 4042]